MNGRFAKLPFRLNITYKATGLKKALEKSKALLFIWGGDGNRTRDRLFYLFGLLDQGLKNKSPLIGH